MTWLPLFIPGWLKRGAFYIVAGLLAVAGVFLAGKREGRQRAKSEAMEADRETDRRIDKADVSRGDPAADREWLRKRADK